MLVISPTNIKFHQYILVFTKTNRYVSPICAIYKMKCDLCAVKHVAVLFDEFADVCFWLI